MILLFGTRVVLKLLEIRRSAVLSQAGGQRQEFPSCRGTVVGAD